MERQKRFTTEALFSLQQDHPILLKVISNFCTLFWGPNLSFCRSLINATFFDPLIRLKKYLDCNPADAVFQLQQAVGSFSDPSVLFACLEEAYIRLFVTTNGPISPYLYASCYEKEDFRMMDGPAIDMQRRLLEAGLAVEKDKGEPPDHLCIELEYLYFLLERGWNENQMDRIQEARSFARTAMIPWISRFKERLNGETKCRFYPLSASILLSCLRFVADPA